MTTNNQHHYSSRRASVAAAPALQLRNSLLRISCAVSLKVLLLIVLGVPFLRPLAVSAHEVYVLDHAEISRALTTDSPNPFSVLPEQEKLFLTYGAAIAFGVIIILFLSVSPLFERVCNPWLSKLKPWAPLIARVTLGLSIIASGYYGAIFGPELPLTQIVSPDFVPLLGIVLVYAGVFIMLGLLTRIVSVLGVILFAILICVDHTYMLTYASYLGEFILFVILGGGAHSLDEHVPFLNKVDNYSKKFRKRLEPYSFLIMRILFGVSVFFASFYSKFLHSNLALATVTEYHLTDFFHFTPLFLVLGAFLVEAAIGAFVALGIELRLVAIVFTFFLTLSIAFFGESVWPHVILFGVNLALFCHGYDRYTVESAVLSAARQKGEPVL